MGQTPLVSIIVPYRDHRDSLPRLLESIRRQSLKDLEVVVVDDASETGCADIVAAFAGSGLCVRLTESKERLYVKDARLAGVREARADCFMFADADDMLWGETVLEAHVAMWRETRADVVHFRSVFTDGAGNFTGNFSWADPFAPELRGKAVFSAYTRAELDGSALWNKIFSRELWLRIMPALLEFPLEQACEDIFLNTRVFFQAQSYAGSDLAGYGFHYRPEKRDGKALMRAAALFRMLDMLIPRLYEDNGDPEDIARLEGKMANFLGVCAGRAGIHATNPDADMEAHVREALLREDCVTIIKTLLLGAGVNGRKLRNICRTAIGL